MHCSILLRRRRCFAIAHHHRRPPTRCSSHSAASLRYDRDTGIVYSNGRPIYQTIIGIEIHAQLDVSTKLFSCAPRITSVSSRRHRHHSRYRRENNKDIIFNSHDNIIDNHSGRPNTYVHAYDLAYPGTLPAPPSQEIIHSSLLACAVLNCNIHKISRFERKHYFYPDLPQGYQITQQRWPLATDGFVTFVSNTSNDGAITNIQQQQSQQDDKSVDVTAKKKQRRRGVSNIVVDSNVNNSDNTVIKQPSNEPTNNTLNTITLRIERIQLEQDTGKTTTIITRNNAEEETADGTLQQTADTTSLTHSLIDYNRAGCALIEIVSYPDLRSASDAASAVERIRTLLKHVGSCDGRMEEGSLRCDLNVSIAPIIEENCASDNDLSLQTLQILSDDNRIGKEEDLQRLLHLPPNTGHRVEVKNLNSLRQIVAAAEYEALRQSELALLLTPTGRETRTFHVKPTSTLYPLGGETYCIRTKGDAVDYRFLPEPDLPPLILDEETLGIEVGLSSHSSYSSSSMTCPIQDYIDRYMPESIESTKLRLVNDYSLTEDVAHIITSDPPAIILFEEAVTFAKSELRSMNENIDDDDKVLQSLPTMVANCLCNDLYALIKKSAVVKCSSSSNAAAAGGEGVNDDYNIDNGGNVTTSTLDHPISVEYTSIDGHRLGALVAMVANGMLTSSMAKKVLAVMYDDDGQAGMEGKEEESKTSSSLRSGYSHPNDIANKYGWRIISVWDTLVQLCDGVVNDPQHLAQLEQYKMGDERKRWKIDKFYVGKIMAASNGNAHPERMKEALAFVLNKTK